VAIHEAMEQQTISITKAGIQATLNARTSILAAANPIKGRYDTSKTLRQNVDISPPIMSRFDLFFVVLDQCNDVTDYNIARHILRTHQDKARAVQTDFSMQDLQLYIKFAKTLKPKISREAKQHFVNNYSRLRQNDMGGTSKSSYRITVRQLESMIRLSEALARVHLEEEVKPVHVKEAARLLEMSIIRVESEEVDLNEEQDEEAFDFGDYNGGDDDMDDDGEGDDENVDDRDNQKEGGNAEMVTDEKAVDGGEGGDTKMDTNAPGEGEKKKKKKKKKKKALKISYDEYVKITNLIVMYLRKQEAQGVSGLRQNDLINWYVKLKEQQGEVEGVEKIMELKRQVEKIVKRLGTKDGVLVVLPSNENGEESSAENPILSVHPNYDPQYATEHMSAAKKNGEKAEREMRQIVKEERKFAKAEARTKTGEKKELKDSEEGDDLQEVFQRAKAPVEAEKAEEDEEAEQSDASTSSRKSTRSTRSSARKRKRAPKNKK